MEAATDEVRLTLATVRESARVPRYCWAGTPARTPRTVHAAERERGTTTTAQHSSTPTHRTPTRSTSAVERPQVELGGDVGQQYFLAAVAHDQREREAAVHRSPDRVGGRGDLGGHVPALLL